MEADENMDGEIYTCVGTHTHTKHTMHTIIQPILMSQDVSTYQVEHTTKTQRKTLFFNVGTAVRHNVSAELPCIKKKSEKERFCVSCLLFRSLLRRAAYLFHLGFQLIIQRSQPIDKLDLRFFTPCQFGRQCADF